MVGIAVVKAGWRRWEAAAAPVDLVIGCATYEAVLWCRDEGAKGRRGGPASFGQAMGTECCSDAWLW